MISDWDDLRFCLAVARGKNLRAAAEELGVHHATVSRRIRAFEERLDVRVFDRSRTGYEVTDAGEEVLDRARAVETEFLSLERRARGRNRELAGTLRVTSIQELAFALAPHMRSFGEQYPRVEVHLTTSNVYADLDRREADVAVRIASAPPDHLVGRRIGSVGIAPYASVDYLDKHSDRSLREHEWIGWVDFHRDVPMERWLRAEIDEEKVRCRVDDMATLRNAVLTGVGVGHLLCWVGEPDRQLRRVGPLLDNHDLYLWVLTHPDLRETARVRAFLTHIADALAVERDLLQGRREPLNA